MSPGYDDFVNVLNKCDKLIREDIAGSDSF